MCLEVFRYRFCLHKRTLTDARARARTHTEEIAKLPVVRTELFLSSQQSARVLFVLNPTYRVRNTPFRPRQFFPTDLSCIRASAEAESWKL